MFPFRFLFYLGWLFVILYVFSLFSMVHNTVIILDPVLTSSILTIWKTRLVRSIESRPFRLSNIWVVLSFWLTVLFEVEC